MQLALLPAAALIALSSGSPQSVTVGASTRLLVTTEDTASQRAWLDHARRGWGITPRHRLRSTNASSFVVPEELARSLAADPSLQDRGWCVSVLRPVPMLEKASFHSPAARRAEGRSYVPNDPLYSDQWGPACIDLETTWTISRGRRRATLAVLDTGAELDHPDLADNLVAGYDFVNLDDHPYDDNGHGTAVSGVAAAVIDNGIGIAGCVQEWIMPVKVLSAWGIGYVDDIVIGIEWAVEEGADVLALPFGMGTPSPILESVCRWASEEGALLIAVAGASGTDHFMYPAAYTSVSGIAALMTDCETPAPFNNFGFGDHQVMGNVEFLAPGVDILTIVGGGYGYYSGTASACAFVAAVAAGYRDAAPSASAATIRHHMQTHADDLGDPEHHGYGRIDGAPCGRSGCRHSEKATNSGCRPGNRDTRATSWRHLFGRLRARRRRRSASSCCRCEAQGVSVGCECRRDLRRPARRVPCSLRSSPPPGGR